MSLRNAKVAEHLGHRRNLLTFRLVALTGCRIRQDAGVLNARTFRGDYPTRWGLQNDIEAFRTNGGHLAVVREMRQRLADKVRQAESLQLLKVKVLFG